VSNSFIIIVPHIIAICKVVLQLFIVVNVANLLIETNCLFEVLEQVTAVCQTDFSF